MDNDLVLDLTWFRFFLPLQEALQKQAYEKSVDFLNAIDKFLKNKEGDYLVGSKVRWGYDVYWKEGDLFKKSNWADPEFTIIHT